MINLFIDTYIIFTEQWIQWPLLTDPWERFSCIYICVWISPWLHNTLITITNKQVKSAHVKRQRKSMIITIRLCYIIVPRSISITEKETGKFRLINTSIYIGCLYFYDKYFFLSSILNWSTVVFFQKRHNKSSLFYKISLCEEYLNICIFYLSKGLFFFERRSLITATVSLCAYKLNTRVRFLQQATILRNEQLSIHFCTLYMHIWL